MPALLWFPFDEPLRHSVSCKIDDMLLLHVAGHVLRVTSSQIVGFSLTADPGRLLYIVIAVAFFSRNVASFQH